MKLLVLACDPRKVSGQLISKTAQSVISREVTGAAARAVATNAKKCFTWFASSAVSKTSTTAIQKSSQVAERQLIKEVASKGTPSLDVLSKAGQVMDRNGLTKAGRALQKHGERPGSIFPKPTGNVKRINQHGQDILDNILTHPDSKSSFWKHRSFGDVIDVSIPSQGGTRFRRNGDFIGFLEP